MLRNAQPVYFIPTGLSDSIDQTNAFSGACRSLQNLVFDRTDPQGLTARAGVTPFITTVQFTTYLVGISGAGSTPGNVSFLSEHGSFLFGFIACVGGTHTGKDVPFIYNLVTNSLSGWAVNPVVANCPATLAGLPAANGEIPSIALVGPILYLTHPNYAAPNFGTILTFTGAATATYAVGTTGGNALPSRPTNVASYMDRAWFATGTTVFFTDTLANNIAAVTQSLNANEGDVVVALYPLTQTQNQQGIFQALLSFGASGTIYQIRGNYGGSPTLTSNSLFRDQVSSSASAVGPGTITAVPNGVAFLASDGVRLINQQGVLSFLNGQVDQGQPVVDDILQPFQNCSNRPLACATFQNGVYRISLPTSFRGLNISGDFWYDYTRKRWNGPHTFNYNYACGWNGKTYLSSTATGFTSQVFLSKIVTDIAAVFADNSIAYSFDLVTANFPLNQRMEEQFLIESTVELSQTTTTQLVYNVTAFNEADVPLNNLTITTTGMGSLWNGTTWGGSLWGAASHNSKPYRLSWSLPLVFNKIYFEFSGLAAPGMGIKNQFYRFQDTGYMLQSA